MQKMTHFIPDYLDDIAPSLARKIEHCRARALDWLLANDYQLIVPPLVEYLETLTAGDSDLDLQTFKMTDTLSGRTLGIRSDQTPQIARFDATNGNNGKIGGRRYCYCGPVLHNRALRPWSSREELQLGAELFDMPAPLGDWEIIRCALGTLQSVDMIGLRIDIGYADLFTQLVADIEEKWQKMIMYYISRRDIPAIHSLVADDILLPETASVIENLIHTRGNINTVYDIQKKNFSAMNSSAFDEIYFVARQLELEKYDVRINLSNLGTYGYHTGIVFSIYSDKHIVAQGGRYLTLNNGEGIGFSIDLRFIGDMILLPPISPAVSVALIGDDSTWFLAIEQLRKKGRRIRFVENIEKALPPLLKKENNRWMIQEK